MFDWCVLLWPKPEGKGKGALLAEARWELGTSITFAFMDGDQELQARVSEVAQEWIDRTGINLRLQRQNNSDDAVVRISFRLSGSWSALGRGALAVDRSKPTMNFGWLTRESSDDAVRRVVLHEFGHALGFIHEHQNPSGGIQWNRKKVIESLSGPPNDWSIEEIEFNVLDTPDPRELINTPYDPDSIMLYKFPADWTTNGVSTKSNSDLSPTDIELARSVYPS